MRMQTLSGNARSYLSQGTTLLQKNHLLKLVMTLTLLDDDIWVSSLQRYYGSFRWHQCVAGNLRWWRGVRHGLESRTSHLESLGISHKIWNLALESGIFWLIKVREFPNNSGYSNSVQLVICSSRCGYKLVGLL